jgi:hypothetical protein
MFSKHETAQFVKPSDVVINQANLVVKSSHEAAWAGYGFSISCSSVSAILHQTEALCALTPRLARLMSGA